MSTWYIILFHLKAMKYGKEIFWICFYRFEIHNIMHLFLSGFWNLLGFDVLSISILFRTSDLLSVHIINVSKLCQCGKIFYQYAHKRKTWKNVPTDKRGGSTVLGERSIPIYVCLLDTGWMNGEHMEIIYVWWNKVYIHK